MTFQARLQPPGVRVLTFSLCSFLLTITAVICWSINMRMVTSSAGSAAARYTHQGFPPKGGMSQPLWGFVGWRRRRRGRKRRRRRVLKGLVLSVDQPNVISQAWTTSQILTSFMTCVFVKIPQKALDFCKNNSKRPLNGTLLISLLINSEETNQFVFFLASRQLPTLVTVHSPLREAACRNFFSNIFFP